ncbi:MAG: cyclic nucleotide-gated ion channel [Alphaproteobacteria bacterium]
MTESLRLHAWRLLERGERNGARRATSAILISAILATALSALLGTLPALDGALARVLEAAWSAAALAFTAEYLARLWVAPERDPGGHEAPWRARRGYLVSFLGAVDLAAAAPLWLSLAWPEAGAPLAVASLVALLKLPRFVPAIGLLASVIRGEARSLLSALLAMLVLLVFVCAIMYVIERETQPEAFASIPHALWWGIVTIASVGYGDVTPITPLGRLFAGAVMVLGVAVFAVPAAILATGFAAELKRRDFLVTWRTVAEVPLFATLDASRIAAIARLLKAEVVPAHQVVVRRGDPADSMFFIMGGEVQVEVAPEPVRLKEGQYFGEIALLRESTRTATVTTLTECQLLALAAADFRRLMAEQPEIKASMERVAEARVHGQGRDRPPTAG